MEKKCLLHILKGILYTVTLHVEHTRKLTFEHLSPALPLVSCCQSREEHASMDTTPNGQTSNERTSEQLPIHVSTCPQSVKMAFKRSPPSSEKHGAWSAKDELKKWLREAENIIKSRGDTMSAGDAQIAGLQSELDDLRKQLAEEKRRVESLGSESQAKAAASRDPEHVNAELARAFANTRIEELEARLQAHQEEELKRASKAFDDILTSNQDSCQQYQFLNKVTPCMRTRIRLRERQRARAHRQRQ